MGTSRALLLAAAALGVAVALAVAVYVIPPTRTTWVPNTIGAGGSVPAFWVSVAGNLAFAGIVALAATITGRGARIRWLLALLGTGALVQALAFLDAERAFSESPLRSELTNTITALRVVAVADGVAGVLVLAVLARSLLQERRRVHDPEA